jgi:hypothetical protein
MSESVLAWMKMNITPGLVCDYIISWQVILSCFQMKRSILLNAKIEVLESKINRCRRELLDTYMPREVDRLDAQIMVLQWVQARLQDMVINNESKDTKIIP